jgi:putative Mn2+ efflux pump MntP
MDAFAVAICKGLEFPKFKLKNALVVGLYFGVFQAAMPLAGYFIGAEFTQYIEDFDHWIAAGLLSIIGIRMIVGVIGEKYKSHRKTDNEEPVKPKKKGLGILVMIPLAIATSIDALITGMSMAMMQVNIYFAIALIGSVTLVISAVGVSLGNAVGTRLKSKAEVLGGIVLVIIAIKILISHLG